MKKLTHNSKQFCTYQVRKIVLITFLLILTTHFSFAQCNSNEVKVKIELTTDQWGDEISWMISSIPYGTPFMQGGQGGTYANNTTYVDSSCISADSCLSFSIYDSYGDGILSPGGYKLYLNNILVGNDSSNIGDSLKYVFHCTSSSSTLTDALNALRGHINGSLPLTPAELTQIQTIIGQLATQVSVNDQVIILAKSVIADYDNQIGALFTTPSTQYGFSKNPTASPNLELERVMLTLEQAIFDFVFTPEVYKRNPKLLNGYKFNSCRNFPGYIDPPLDSSINHSIMIKASFADPDGINPHYDISNDRSKHALRPTGLYLAPGSISSITVPDSLVGKNYYVRVGSHDWDLTDKGTFRRMGRITKKFLIDSTTIEVFNPMGGAISILVPYGAKEGIVSVSVSNAIEAPFFSIKSFYETTDFDAELNKSGLWAVFETDNVMFTIPKHSIVPGQYDIKQTLQDWEKALRGINSIMARQIIPDKHNMYMITDVDIRASVFSLGYPMSNTPITYTNVPGRDYFIDGVESNYNTNFHEYGHAINMSKFPGEGEAIVNFLYIIALNYGIDIDLNEAVKKSTHASHFDIDNTALDRIVSNTFGYERDITNNTTNEVRYQHRGYAHYFEIVNLFGWCPLRNFWKQELIDLENGIDHGMDNQDVDSRILRLSRAAQQDLRPLFYFFGILPQDPTTLQNSINQYNIPPSRALYDRLQEYFNLIPQNNADFVNYALTFYPDLYTNGPNEHPDYGKGWYYQKSLTYNTAEYQQRTATLQSIINQYYPNGQPTNNGAPDVCCLLDSMTVNLVDDEVIVKGGISPYQITIDTTSNIQTITAMDFDSCTTTAQYVISNISETNETSLHVFPNPTTGELQIDFGTIKDQVTISIMSVVGNLIHTQTVTTNGVLNYQLPETNGVYLLKITYSVGEYDHIRVVKK